MGHFIEQRKKERVPRKKIAVLYHKDCSDGFGAAWAAWKKLGNKADYIGVAHDESPPPPGLAKKEIYLIDFCYPRKEMERLRKASSSLTVIDHHKSVKDVVLAMDRYVYDDAHSGAVLAWRFFHKGRPVPMLLRYIEDVDLWRLALPNVWPIKASLYNLYDFDFRVWDRLARDFESKEKLKKYFREGKIIAEYETRAVQKLLSRADTVRFEGYKALAVNSSKYSSELGAALADAMPPLGIVYYQAGNQWVVSLRGNAKGKKKVDCGELAKKYGGGGHPFSAGFVVNSNKALPWKLVK